MSGFREWRARRGWAVGRRRIILGSAAILLASAAGAPSYAVRLAAALDVDDMWSARSPGVRGDVRLVKRPPVPLAEREARVAPRTRSAPAPAPPPVELAGPTSASRAGPEVAAPTRFPGVGPAMSDPLRVSATQLAGFGPEPLATGFIGVGAAGIGIGVPPAPVMASTELAPQRFDPEMPAGVPEPATWATLILGFSLMGLRARTLRQSSSTEAARSSELVGSDI